ncbi:hypothetical protein PFISCL1PPCAC_9848 [Pristionchus fissidentatus]|uniref:Tudor domain-containing protein n=1 Tax=Pristionchus fissidentatus TaxID=1538716 RepID=A0AAV5VGP9_9BILA|nr:hypothetical protein PFISCL1PPCAC_9848 [Pristionchus fissidentatus]
MYSPHMAPMGASAASFFAAASAIDALDESSRVPPMHDSTTAPLSSLIGVPLVRTTVPPPAPVPHIAFFPYAPNTAPITVSITYPSSSSTTSSGVYSGLDSPRPTSRAWKDGYNNYNSTSPSSASSVSASERLRYASPRRERFGCVGGDADDASSTSPPLSLLMDDQPECLEVQPVESMFGSGEYTLNCIVKGVVGEGAVTSALAATAAGAARTSINTAASAPRRNSAGGSSTSSAASSMMTASSSSAFSPSTTDGSYSRMSDRSETVTADSGRATGGLASSLSPMDDNSATTTPNGTMFDANPMYEFEIPNSLVGLIIGVKGKTIKELSMRTDVRMLIRQHHETPKVDTHQICQVRGKRDKINRCLQMLRKRFPPVRFPELNLQPVLPPALPTNLADLLNAQPSWLTLPESVACEAAVVHLIDASHLFIQQPTHPSYSSLALLDQYMIRLYTQSEGIPEVPHPCDTGLLCAAPVMQAWFRAVIVMYFPEEDEALVRFVDYGGYAKIARSELRQIRTDLMTLPFQATECFLAHVQPVDGTSQWSARATEFLRELVSGKVVDVTLVGYSIDEKIPVVEIDVIDEIEGTRQRVDRLMLEAGLAKAADPSKVQKITKLSADKKPILSKQGSYSAAAGSVMSF